MTIVDPCHMTLLACREGDVIGDFSTMENTTTSDELITHHSESSEIGLHGNNKEVLENYLHGSDKQVHEPSLHENPIVYNN